MMNIEDIIGGHALYSSKRIFEEAYRRGVNFKKHNRIIIMSLGEYSYRIRNRTVFTGLNSNLTKIMTDNKVVNTSYIRSLGYSAPENALFEDEQYIRAWNWAKYILPVVVKPNDGNAGKLVHVEIDNESDFKDAYNRVYKEYSNVLIEEFISGNEYRFTYVDKELIGVVQRVPANVTGDGTHSIRELVNIKNDLRRESNNPIHKLLKLNSRILKTLESQGLDYDYVPRKKEVIYLRKNSNVSTGGDAIDVTDNINPTIKQKVNSIMKTYDGLRVSGVDVIINNNEYHILGVNAKPMVALHEHPWIGNRKNSYSKIVDAMFPNTVSK